MKSMNRRVFLKNAGAAGAGLYAGIPPVIKEMFETSGKEPNMKPLDYGRSFLLGTWPGNEVRFCVESRTRIIDDLKGKSEDYIVCASCKSEDTFAKKNLFYEDNYDFLPIFGPEYGLIFRRKAWLNPNYRSCQKTKEMFDGPLSHLVEGTSPAELFSTEDMLKATYEWFPIIAQTEITNDATGLRAVIEYPVKTMNTRRRDAVYQVDTGPVAFPDLKKRVERLVDTISLAFVAFNAPHFADFVIEAPTSIAPSQGTGEAQVYHYSRRISLPAANRLYVIR